MNLVLTEPRVRLICLNEPRMIETLDMDRLVDDLADGVPPTFLTPERICAQHLIVVAMITQPGAKSHAKPGTSSGRYVGLLGACYDMAGGQAFLRLDMACVAPRARGHRLMSRLLARAAAERVERTSILAARTATPSWFHTLRHFAANLEGSTFHPAPAGGVVALRNAALARRIATVLCPERRYDVATGMLHGRCAVPMLKLRRHASAEAWCEAARDADPALSEQLLAVIDLHGVAPAILLAQAGLAQAGQIAPTG
jgi:hypothetical protein